MNRIIAFSLGVTTGLALSFFLSGCAAKSFRFNAMTCPQDYSEARIKTDLHDCHYYDYEAIKAGEKLPQTCAACMQEKGYEVNQ